MNKASPSVIKKLSSTTGKRSKAVHKGFAQDIAAQNDIESIRELVGLLASRDRNIQSDVIEVLYETGYLKPDLISDHHAIFSELLSHKNNRLVWGAMIALSCISKTAPEIVFASLPMIQKAVDNGTVITKDAGVAVYANLATVKKQRSDVLPLLFNELRKCPDKQLAQYAEKSVTAMDKEVKGIFLDIINSRLKTIEKASQIKRVTRVRKAVEKI